MVFYVLFENVDYLDVQYMDKSDKRI